MKCALIGNAKADAERYVPMRCARGARRVFYREMVGDEQVTHTLFLYNGYLCIRQLFSNEPWNVYKEFIWDPTEPIATRPLCFRQNGQQATFLMHDGNKNVTDVVTVGPHNSPVAHYEYAPFGAATHTGPRALDNPFRFSSEFADDSLALVYYNYRHYNPTDGRWCSRDLIEDKQAISFCFNNPIDLDFLGMYPVSSLEDLEMFFLGSGFQGYGITEYKVAPYTLSDECRSSPKKDPSCPTGCRIVYTGKVTATYQENYEVSMDYPVLTKDISVRQHARLANLVKYIQEHEEAHKEDLIIFAQKIKSRFPIEKSASISFCDGENEEEKLNELLAPLYREVRKEASEGYEQLTQNRHKEIGESIDISEALVAGRITIQYPDGHTEIKRLD